VNPAKATSMYATFSHTHTHTHPHPLSPLTTKATEKAKVKVITFIS